MTALLFALSALLSGSPADRLVIEGEGNGPGKGKHVVLLAGDEEYRSEEALPQLAKILAKHHGFTCTVLFSLDRDGFIDPKTADNQPGLETLTKANACIMMLRFRRWPDSQMRHFDAYARANKPILALRTSTHAFDFPNDSPYHRYDWRTPSWREFLGETWVSHWGEHGRQATRGVADSSAAQHPILRNVEPMFGDTDVYEAHPPASAKILLRGIVLNGMQSSDPPAEGLKRNAKGNEQQLNDPPMPLAWIVEPRRVVCTLGSATDLKDPNFRRFLVNSVYWLVGIDTPAKANVELVGKFQPSSFGFEGFRKGLRPNDLR